MKQKGSMKNEVSPRKPFVRLLVAVLVAAVAAFVLLPFTNSGVYAVEPAGSAGTINTTGDPDSGNTKTGTNGEDTGGNTGSPDGSQTDEEAVSYSEAEYITKDDLEGVVAEGKASVSSAEAVMRLNELYSFDAEKLGKISGRLFDDLKEPKDSAKPVEGKESATEGASIDGFSARWTTTQGDTLTFDENVTEGILQINYALSGTSDFNEGGVVFSLPETLLQDEAGNPIGQITLPYADAPNKDNAFSIYRDNGMIRVTNNRPLHSTASGYFQVRITGIEPGMTASPVPVSAFIDVAVGDKSLSLQTKDLFFEAPAKETGETGENADNNKSNENNDKTDNNQKNENQDNNENKENKEDNTKNDDANNNDTPNGDAKNDDAKNDDTKKDDTQNDDVKNNDTNNENTENNNNTNNDDAKKNDDGENTKKTLRKAPVGETDLIPEEDTVIIPESEGESLLKEGNLTPKTRTLTSNILRAPPAQQQPVTADHITIEKVTIRWVSASSGKEESAMYDDLELVPTNDIVPNQQWQLDVAFSGKDEIKAGDLEIVLPAYIWFDRDGNEPGIVTVAVPREGETGKASEFAWKRVGDTIVVTNTKNLSAASKYMIQGTFRMTSPDPNSDPENFTSTYAHQMVDGKNGITDYISNPLFGVVNVTTPNTGETISMTSNEIFATIDTHVEAANASKTAYDKYKKTYNIYYDYTKSGIPDELLPADPEEYLYIKWYVDGRATGNQPFTMITEDTVQDTIYKVEGTNEIPIAAEGLMLGATGTAEGTVKSQDGKTVKATVFEGYTEDDKSCYVWTAYKQSYFEGLDATFKVYNDQKITVTGIDDKVSTSKDATASVAVRLPIKWTIKKEWLYNEDKYDTPLEVIKSRQPKDLKVWLDNKSTGKTRVFTDTLNDDNNWTTEYMDDGVVANYDAFEHTYEVTRHMHGENGTSIDIVTGRGEPVYTANGRWYYKYWGYDHKSTKYDEATHTWTFVNDYHEGIIGGGYDDFEVEKHATNHTDENQKSTADKDLNLLRNGENSTSINYNVHTGTHCLGHTSEPGAWSWETDKHGKRYVTLELHDYGEYFESRKLRNDEFRMATVTMQLPRIYSWVPEKEGSENGEWKDADPVPVNLYARGGDDTEWTLYAVMDTDESITTYNGATADGKTVNLPEGMNETRETIRTNGARAYLDYNVGVILFPSQDIKDKIEEIFESTDYAKAHSFNYVTGRLLDDDANILGELERYDRTYLHGRQLRLAADLDKQTTFTVNDRAGKKLGFENKITLNQQSNITSLDDFRNTFNDYDIPGSKSGVFYDLLPEGMTADLSTVTIDKGTIKSADVIENYKGSGRQLLIVKVDLEENIAKRSYSTRDSKRSDDSYPNITDINSSDVLYGTNNTIKFNSWYTYEEAKNRGITNMRNTAAYEADEKVFGNVPEWTGEKDAPTGENHKESLTEVEDYLRAAMTDLDKKRNDPNFVYAGDTYRITETDFDGLSSLRKYVQAAGDEEWVDGLDNSVYVYEGGKYNYKIVLTSATDTITKDIILLDSIEYYTPMEIKEPGDSEYKAGQIVSKRELDYQNALLEQQGKTPATAEEVWYWKGYFKDIDVSEIEAMGVDVKVYYSTVPDLDITHEAYNPDHTKTAVPEKLADTTVWSTELPDDPSKVTAVALDCRKKKDGSDFELHSQEALIAYMHMQAPTWEQQPEAYGETGYDDPMNNGWAYNNVYMDITQLDEDSMAQETHSYDHYDYTKVGIWALDIEVKKEWDDKNDNDRVRPESVDVHLVREGVDTGRSLTLDESNGWSGKFPHVLMYDEDGNRIYYTLNENPVEDYTSTIKYDSQNMTLTNSRETEKVDIPFIKIWESEEAEGWESNIPNSIKVKLYADGVYTGQTKTVRADENGNWTGIFTGMDKYKDGVEVVYTIEEDVPKDFIGTIDQDTKIIKNIYYPYGDLTVEKNVLNGTVVSLQNEFEYTLLFKDEDGESVPSLFDYVILDEFGDERATGQIGNGGTFTLKNKEKMHVKNIYSGVKYEVKEAPKAGFTLTGQTATNGTISSDKTKEARFENTYHSAGSVAFDAVKTLTGREMERYEFRFEVLDENDQIIRLAANKADGTVSFGAINYTEADDGKTFKYTIVETNRGKGGISYDQTAYKAEVTPVDNGNGTMTCNVTLKKGDEEVDAITFKNEYHAEGELEFKAWKMMNGRTLAPGAFTFELKDSEGNVVATGTNNADGTISFPKVRFDENDIGKEYDYVMTEKKGKDTTVNYSDEAYDFHVAVADNGDGTLSFTQEVREVNRSLVKLKGENAKTAQTDSGDDWYFISEETGKVQGRPYVTIYVKDYTEQGKNADFILSVIMEIAEFGSIENNYYSEVCATAVEEWDARTMVAPDAVIYDTPNAEIYVVTGYEAETAMNYGFIYSIKTEPSEEPAVPVFTNTLKDGKLSVEKFVDNPDQADPGQTFKFRVEFDGPGVENLTGDQGKATTNNFETGSAKTPENLRKQDTTERVAKKEVQPEEKKQESTGYNSKDEKDVTGEEDTNSKHPITEEQMPEEKKEPGLLDSFISFFTGETVYADEADIVPWTDYTYNGSSIKWRIDSEGCLHIVPIDGDEGVFNNAASDPIYSMTDGSPWTDDYYSDGPIHKSIKSVTTDGKTIKCYGPIFPLFNLLVNLESGDFSGFDVSEVVNFVRVFEKCESLTDISTLSKWDMSKAVRLSYMFDGCSSLTDVVLPEMQLASYGSYSRIELDNMFRNCTSLTTLDLSMMEVAGSLTMMEMFDGCSSLESLNVEGFDITEQSGTGGLFDGCTKLKEITVGENWSWLDANAAYPQPPSTPPYTGYWINAEDDGSIGHKTIEELRRWDGESDWAGTWVWETAPIAVFDSSDGSLKFYNAETAKSFEPSSTQIVYEVDVNNAEASDTDWYPPRVTWLGRQDEILSVSVEDEGIAPLSTAAWFFGCRFLESVDLSKLDTSRTKHMQRMFGRCESLETLDLSAFSTPSLKSAYKMFDGCENLEYLNIENFDSSNTTVFEDMFPQNKQYSTPKLSKVVLGENWVNWGSNGLLPLPPTDTTSGKWMREDGTIDGLSPADLATKYVENPSSYAGTWVWEPKVEKYTLKFDRNGGTGSMADDPNATAVQDYTIPKNTFSNFGYKFKNWVAGGEFAGHTYDDMGTIPAHTYPPDYEVTLYAQWEPIQGLTNLGNGVYEFELQDNMAMNFNQVPAGTTYRVYEETPDGWVLVGQSGQSGVIQPLETSVANFKNKYEPGVTSVQFTGRKYLDGKPADGFKFILKEGNDVIEENVMSVNGMVQFKTITYTEAGTHKYTIEEIPGNDSTINYDTHTENITVEVTDNGDGTMSKKVTYDSNDGITFNNETKEEYLYGNLSINKWANTTDANKDDEFTFRIYLTNANGTPYTGEVTYEVGNEKKTVTPDMGNITITGVKAGESVKLRNLPKGTKYIVTESDIPKGWSLETGDNESGTIEANGDHTATFRNTYSAKGSAVLEAHKKLEGGTLAEGEYTFELQTEDGQSIERKTNGVTDMNSKVLDDNDRSVDNPWYKTAIVSFDPIEFTEADIGKEYTYKIVEIPGNDATIDYDPHEETVTVKVSDNGSGFIKADVTYASGEGALFTNSVKPGELSLKKEIANYTEAAKDTEFTFTVDLKDAQGNVLDSEYTYTKTDSEEEGKVRSGGTVTLKGDESILIAGLPDGATYTITEAETKGWTLTETSNAEGTIKANGKCEAVFKNVYFTEGSVTFGAKKKLIGRDILPDTYKFIVEDTNGNQVDYAYAQADGTVTFNGIDYTAADDGNTYIYYIKEVEGDEADISYDGTSREVKVKVDDNGEGELVCDVTYDETGMEFVNEVSYSLYVSKQVEGNEADPDRQFTFTLDVEGREGKPLTNNISFTRKSGDFVMETGSISPEDLPYEFRLTSGDTMEFARMLNGVKYTVTETHDDYYTADAEVKSGTIDGADATESFVNTINWFDVVLKKTNKEGKLLKWVRLAVYNGDKCIEEWQTDGTHHVMSLRPGDYVLREEMVSNPIIYQKAEDIPFTVDIYGNVTYDKPEETTDDEDEAGGQGDGDPQSIDNKVTMIDDYVKTKVEVKKVWDDDNDRDKIRPDEVTVRLLANGKDTGLSGVLNEAGQWAYTFEDIDMYADEQLITYTITEDAVTKYTPDTDITGNQNSGFTVTNKYTPEKVDVKGSKVWSDSDDQDGIRPDSITIVLKANGNVLKETKAYKDSNYAFEFKDLWKNEDGVPITYTIDEIDVATGYTKSVDNDNYKVTNTHQPEKRDITFTKVWDDDDNRDGLRPDSITVILVKDGVDTAVSVTANAPDYSGTFTGLDKYRDGGTEIVYTIKEAGVTGYTNTIAGNAGDGFEITNTHTPEKISVSGEKTWNDGNDQDGIRPDSVTVVLYKGTEAVDEKTVFKDNNWKYSFDDLPKYENGSEITYSVKERAVEGYTSVVTGYDIANTHTPETTSVNVTKTWADGNDQDGIRPGKVTVTLFADGKEKDSAELNEENGWKHSFTNLPKFSAGKEIEYTIQEEAVEGYETTADGYKLTNTHTPGTVSVKATKVWDDGDNRDGKRSDVTFKLMADGEAVVGQEKAIAKDAEDTTVIWENLPEKKAGKTIIYTVEEAGVTDGKLGDYTVTAAGDAKDGFTITNAYTPEETEVEVTKVWDDSDDQDGIRPESVSVELLADGRKCDEAVLNEANKWAYTFTELPKFDNGTEITYTISETKVEGYEVSVEGSAADGYTLTNTHETETTKIDVTKVWSDNDDQDGIRPASVTVRLYADGEDTGKTLVLNAAGSWAGSFEDLDVYASGEAVVYTVEEDRTAVITGTDGPGTYGIAVTGDVTKGVTFTNTHTPETVSVSGKKTWDDNKDQDGKRPNLITVRLHADGKVIDSREASEAGGWKYEFKDLPKYKDGKEILYTVTEDAVDDYKPAYGTGDKDYDITNSYTPGKTSVTVEKAWDDDNDRDGIRPESVKVKLFADGDDTGKTLVLDESNKWEGSFGDLDLKKNGKAIAYTVEEVKTDVITGTDTPSTYAIAVDGDAVKGYTITNTHTPEVTGVEGTKTWNDSNDQDGKRPEEITVRLHADGVEKDSVKVKADKDGNWTYKFENLAKNKAGKAIKYTVTEDKVEGYETTVNGYNITNTYETETTTVEGSKTWDDNNDQDGHRPEEITVRLHADGVEKDSVKVKADKDGNWTYKFEDLPKYKDSGVEIVYTVTEDAEEDYTTIYDTSKDSYNITNRYTPGKTSVTVEKAWADGDDQDGIRPASVTVKLLADGSDTGKTLELNAENRWEGDFTELDEKKDGKAIVYTVEEVKTDVITGTDGAGTYAIEVSGDAVKGYTITNTHTTGTVSVKGTKTWDDNDNQDGHRPEQITVRLHADGEELDSATVKADEDGNWTYEFNGLPKYKDSGVEIIYTVTEDANEDYTTIYKTSKDNYDITNKYTPGKTSVTVEKAWHDGDDQDGIRPASVTVKLLADGSDTGKTLELNADNRWEADFTELDEKKDGKAIVYTVEEVKTDVITGTDGQGTYAIAVSGDAVKGYTITNTHTPDTVSVKGTKTWDDNDDQDGHRPEQITVRLHADGDEADSATVKADEDGNWTYEFNGLPKHKDSGAEIIYTVTEDANEDYTTIYKTSKDNYDITNKYTPGKTSVTVEKAWDDSDNQDGIRPASVTVKLLADGSDTGKTLVLDESNKWEGDFTELDEKKEGKAIVYTVEEVKTDVITGVDGPGTYAIAVDGDAVKGYTITNNHTPEVTNVEGTKTWIDSNDQDGKRPDEITVRLYADGAEKDSVKVKADKDGNWTYKFENLAKNEAGKAIEYTVTEDKVESYETVVNGYNITNTYETETVTVSGTKTWDDNDNQDGHRPEQITVRLHAGGEELDSATVKADEDGNWTYEFNGLPKYKDSGVEIIYTVTEDANEDYTTIYETSKDNYDITNKYTPGKTSVTVEKAWHDADNRDGIRPESVTVKLFADGVDTGKALVLSEVNRWEGDFTELDEKKDGNPIVYTVEEVKTDVITGTDGHGTYAIAVSGDAVKGYTITNTHTPDEKPGEAVAQITGDKKLFVDGIESKPAAGEFTFEIRDIGATYYPDDKGLPMSYENRYESAAVIRTVTNDSEGGIDFGTFTYKYPGEYRYAISEVNTGAEGVTYDSEVRYVAVTVTEEVPAEGENGTVTKTLTANVTYKDGAEFTNTKVTKKPVVISKTDVVTGNELPGAKLVITDKETGEVVIPEWTSGEEALTFELLPGTYVLTETEAPDGYILARPCEFTVDENGLVGSDKVVMTNRGELVYSMISMNITLAKIWKDSKGEVIAWPENAEVEFVLQVMDGEGNWIDYKTEDGNEVTALLTADMPVFEFKDLPGYVDGKLAEYRAVETTTLKDYKFVECESTDLEKRKGEITAVNASTKKEEPETNEGDNKKDKKEPKTDEGDKDKKEDQPATNRPSGGTSTRTITPATVVRQAGASAQSTGAVTRATSTGDSNNMTLWIVLVACAAAGICAGIILSRKRRRSR